MSNERTASVSQMIPDVHDIDLLTADIGNSNNNQKLFTPAARSGNSGSVLLGSSNNLPQSPSSYVQHPNIISPILSSVTNDNYGNVFSNSALDIQRPLSVQDVTIPSNMDGFVERSFSAHAIERPLSSMEIDSNTFKNDVANLITWINTLTPNQLRAMIDNLLPSLSDEILNYTKSKLANFQFQNNQDGLRHMNSPMMYQSVQNNEPVNLDSVLNDSMGTHLQQPWSPPMHNLQRALSPGGYSSFDRSALLQEASFNRPRSADPYSKLINQQSRDLHRSSSKTRLSSQQRLDNFDITNLAQQLTQTQINVNDYSNPNLLKLSALSTINNRVQLDSNKKRIIPSSPTTSQPMIHSQSQTISKYDQHPMNRIHSTNSHHPTKEITTPSKPQSIQSTTPKSPAIDPSQLTSLTLLNNIPLWLKTLRLHKYTPVLADTPWKQLIYMTDEDLANMGVSALGARGKLAKAFEVVKIALERGEIE